MFASRPIGRAPERIGSILLFRGTLAAYTRRCTGPGGYAVRTRSTIDESPFECAPEHAETRRDADSVVGPQPAILRDIMVPAQRPPHVARFNAAFDQLGGRGAVFREHVRLQQPGAVGIAEFGIDEAVEIGQTHGPTLTPAAPTTSIAAQANAASTATARNAAAPDA